MTAIGTIPEDQATGVDRGGAIRVLLRDPAAPGSVRRASIELRSGERGLGVRAYSDPLEPSVVIEPLSSLEPGVWWSLSVSGLRDLDDRAIAPVAIRFRTGTTRSTSPTAASWEEARAVFERECAPCHDGRPPLGLDLSSAEGVRATAVGRRSTQVGPAPSAAASAVSGGLSGMMIISPTRPEDSYLVYKMLGDPHIAGEPMPPPHDGGPIGSRASLETVASWIRGGAMLE